MANLRRAGLEVLEGFDNVGAGCALDVARGDACGEGVGKHDLPAARLALFADVRLAVDNVWWVSVFGGVAGTTLSTGHTKMGISVIVIIGRPKERSNNRGSFYPAKGQSKNSHHLLIRDLGEGYDLGSECVIVLGILLNSVKPVSLLSQPECVSTPKTLNLH